VYTWITLGWSCIAYLMVCYIVNATLKPFLQRASA